MAPLVALVSASSGRWLGMAGAIWLLVSRWPVQKVERARIRTAADVQEQFDTEVFGLPWNGIKSDRVLPHQRVAAQRRHLARHGDQRLDKLRDWYPDPGSPRPPLDVLACQGINAGWNAALYGEVAAVSIGLLTVAVTAGILVAVIGDLLLADYLVAIVLPSTPAFVEATDAIDRSRQYAAGWAFVDRVIARAWEDESRSPGSVTFDRCRAIQDLIWDLRRAGIPVPDWYYELRRKAHHHDAVVVSGLRASGGGA